MRLRIAERMKEAQNTAASLTTFNEADMSEVIRLREKYKEKFVKEHNVKLGFMSIFMKACAVALQEMPVVNSRLDDDELIIPNYVDISVAVATPKVPCVFVCTYDVYIIGTGDASCEKLSGEIICRLGKGAFRI